MHKLPHNFLTFEPTLLTLLMFKLRFLVLTWDSVYLVMISTVNIGPNKYILDFSRSFMYLNLLKEN